MMSLKPALRVLQYHYDEVDQSSMPWLPRAHRSTALESAVVDNWSDEMTAFRDFAATRVKRHITRFMVGSAGVGLLATFPQVKWLRYTVKGAARFAPVVGWGLLAYDLYHLGDDLDIY